MQGGAPRDWYFEKEASDIDVFFYTDLKVNHWKLAELLQKTGISVSEVKTGDNISEQYARNKHLACVFDTEINGVKVQLMWMRTRTFDSVLPHFPLGIIKIWYKDGDIKLTKEFQLAVKYKAIIKYNDVYNNSDKYIEKIKNKFPDFTYYDSQQKFMESLL